jgi:hypothetical protein
MTGDVQDFLDMIKARPEFPNAANKTKRDADF